MGESHWESFIEIYLCINMHLQCRSQGFEPWVGKTPGEGNGSPLQYSCLGDPTERGAWGWGAAVPGIAESDLEPIISGTSRYFPFLVHFHPKIWQQVPLKKLGRDSSGKHPKSLLARRPDLPFSGLAMDSWAILDLGAGSKTMNPHYGNLSQIGMH